MLRWKPKSTNAQQAARDIIEVASFLHRTFSQEAWLWRGQAHLGHNLEPGMHTRVLNYRETAIYRRNPRTSKSLVDEATNRLIGYARDMELDRKAEYRVPDLALLATLQHYGAATPLLDVTTDPLIALWMIAFANAQKPSSLDNQAGFLFGIIKPPRERWIAPFDARKFHSEEEPSISGSLQNKVWWYEAPDVSDRLRIQRGSFLIGNFQEPVGNPKTTLFLNLNSGGSDWLNKRLSKMGKQSNTAKRTTDAFVIYVPGASKKYLREMLEERSGLTVESVYPTAWSSPLIEQFSKGCGRTRSLALDIFNPPRVFRSPRAASALGGSLSGRGAGSGAGSATAGSGASQTLSDDSGRTFASRASSTPTNLKTAKTVKVSSKKVVSRKKIAAPKKK